VVMIRIEFRMFMKN